MTAHDLRLVIAPITIVLIVLLSVAPVQNISAQTATVITATSSQTPVKIDGIVAPGEWNDTQTTTVATAGMTVAFKYNATGLLFLMQWTNGSAVCNNQYCFGGIELGFLNNTGVMGSTLTPTIMILLSPSFKGGYDEFISQAAATPSTVESQGYKTQSRCVLALSGTTYTGECYRPFKLSNASPYDPFPTLVAGSSVEIGFAVGNFAAPGQHDATNMNSYVLLLGPAATSTASSTTQTTASINATSASSTTTTQITATTTSKTSSSSATPATIYAEEIVVIAVGFSAIVFVVLRRYQ
jgi:hypothetical protein